MIVVNKSHYNKVRGSDEIKQKYIIHDTNTQKQYVVLSWDKIEKQPIVYDNEFDGDVSGYNWSVYQYAMITHREHNQYTSYEYMHQFIMTRADGSQMDVMGDTIDHINEYKLDNRVANLRIANMSMQNANRATRNDKKPPHADLIAIGITDLPRHVRWDNVEKKFVIEKHPALVRHVELGRRKKPMESGTKSNKATIQQKYEDVLARLNALNAEWEREQPEVGNFREIKRRLAQEYIDIVNAVLAYDGKACVEIANDIIATDAVEPHRRTAPNRKKASALPDGCGVTIDMLPTWTYYTAASDKRGDKFTIDTHPKTRAKINKSTTSSRSVTTKDKYEQLMNIYAEMVGNDS